MKHWIIERRSFALNYSDLTNEELCKIINLDFGSDDFHKFEDDHHVVYHEGMLKRFKIERESKEDCGYFAGYSNTWCVEFTVICDDARDVELLSKWIKSKTGID